MCKWVGEWVGVNTCVSYYCTQSLPAFSGVHAKRNTWAESLISLFCSQSYLHDPYFFLYATLATTDGEDLHFTNGTRTTAGSVVQSLHKLKDIDDKGNVIPPKTKEHTLYLWSSFQDGGFFIFADISVRHEGFFKLKFTLFKIIEQVSLTFIWYWTVDWLEKCFFFCYGCTTEPMSIAFAQCFRIRSKCTRQRVRMTKHTRVYMTRWMWLILILFWSLAFPGMSGTFILSDIFQYSFRSVHWSRCSCRIDFLDTLLFRSRSTYSHSKGDKNT